MQPSTSSDRDDGLRFLCNTLALAAVAQGTTAVIRLIGWMEARAEDEGGFLWLAGVCGFQPAKMEDMIRSTLDATPRRRQSIARKMRVHG